MKLGLRFSDGSTAELDVADPTSTVLNLKAAIEAARGTPAAQQRLVYRGRLLSDGDTLAAAGIAEGHVVHVVGPPGQAVAPPPRQPPAPASGALAAPAAHRQHWTAWRRPDVSLNRVFACAVYVLPADLPPARGWQAKCASLLRECAAFHRQEFPGSAIEWSLHGPLLLPFPSTRHRNNPDGFYDAMKAAVLAAAAAGALPPVAAGADGGSLAPPGAASPGFIPTIVDFVCMADWGQEPAGGGKLGKYYIGQWAEREAARRRQQPQQLLLAAPAAAAAAAGSSGAPAAVAPAATPLAGDAPAAAAAAASFPSVDLSDISLAGGSRSSFLGRFKRSTVRAIPPLAGWAGQHSSASDSSGFWDAPIAVGLGLVTQEAWYHPEVPGSAAVTYHEGLGHALAMPHPSVRQNQCVMDLGMYQGVPLIQLNICDEIKADMRAPTTLGAGGGAGGGQHAAAAAACALLASPHVACLVPRSDVGPGGAGLRGAVARAVLRAKLAASEALFGAGSAHNPAAPSLVWLAWAAEDGASSAYEFSLVHCRQPALLLRDAAGAAAGGGGGVAAVASPPVPHASSSHAVAPGGGGGGGGGGDDDGGDDRMSDGSGSDSELQDPAALAARVAAAVAAGRGSSGLQVHGHPPQAPFTLGAEWTETHFAACSDDDDDEAAAAVVDVGAAAALVTPVPVFRTAEYHFREVVWSAAGDSGGGGAAQLARHLAGASPPPGQLLVLLDLPRNIALAFAPRGAAFISCSGLHGVWQSFGGGRWLAAQGPQLYQ